MSLSLFWFCWRASRWWSSILAMQGMSCWERSLEAKAMRRLDDAEATWTISCGLERQGKSSFNRIRSNGCLSPSQSVTGWVECLPLLSSSLGHHEWPLIFFRWQSPFQEVHEVRKSQHTHLDEIYTCIYSILLIIVEVIQGILPRCWWLDQFTGALFHCFGSVINRWQGAASIIVLKCARRGWAVRGGFLGIISWCLFVWRVAAAATWSQIHLSVVPPRRSINFLSVRLIMIDLWISTYSRNVDVSVH